MNERLRSHAAIGYLEVPDFHVAVARRGDPALLDRPVLVGGDPLKRGKVLASSADLQKQGIVSGMPLSEALDRAGDAVWVHTNMPHAREVSGLLRAAVRREIEAVELEGLAGFYWEVSSHRDESMALAARVEKRVRESVDLPIRVGVAPVRFAARWAAEDAGAAGVNVLEAEGFDAYLLKQPIERFPGVGPKTAARLTELGAPDVPSLRALGLERLEVLLGNHGRSLWLLASGNDPKSLRAKRHPTTFSREKSFSESEPGTGQITAQIEGLAESLGSALLREGLGAGRIALRVTLEDTRTLTRSQTLATVVSSATELERAARGLWNRVESDAKRIRKLALVVAGLEIKGAEDRQLGLF